MKPTKTPRAPLAAPPADFDVPLNLSESERWFAAVSLSASPWAGGEAVVMAFKAVHETLDLARVPRDKLPGKLSRSSKLYTLKASHIEILLRVLCGEGGFAFQGEAGPMLATLVGRLRAQVEKSRPKKKGTAA